MSQRTYLNANNATGHPASPISGDHAGGYAEEKDSSPLSHSQASSEPPMKRQRLRSKEKHGKQRKNIERYFDLDAEDDVQDMDGQSGKDMGDEDDGETLSNLEFIDNEPVHDEPMIRVVTDEDREELQSIANQFQRRVWRPESGAPQSDTGHMDPELAYLFVQPPDINRPVFTTKAATDIVPAVTLTPKWKFKGSSVIPGEWIRLKQAPHRGSLAFVVSSNTVLVAREPSESAARRKSQDGDACMRVEFPQALERSVFPQVFPTDDDLAPFQKSRDQRLRGAVFVGTCPALSEGDRVVVVAGEHNGFVGYIVILRDLPVEERRVRYANVRKEYNGTDMIRNDGSGIFVPVDFLRRHVLGPPTTVCPMDRVRVVAGQTNRGSIGRVIEIENEHLTIRLTTGSELTVELRHVARHFRDGDLVRVTRGPLKDCRGLVVSVCTGGGIELFEGVQISQGIPRDNEEFERMSPKVLKVKAADVSFILLDKESATFALDHLAGYSLWSETGHRPVHSMTTRVPGGIILDLLQHDHEADKRIKEAMHTGRRFLGMEVQVAWTGPWKGTRGVVVGDHDSPSGIIATVQREASNERFRVPVNTLVHVHTRLSLRRARFLPTPILKGHINSLIVHASDVHDKRVRTPSPEPTSEQPGNSDEWGAVPQMAGTQLTLSGEKDGDWLCAPGFARKRIDVKLEGLLAFDHRKMRTSPTIRALEGRTGYLLLDKPVTRESLQTEKVTVYAVGKNSTRHGIPGPCIRPLRHNDDGTPITQFTGRVIIIGPDATGIDTKIGCYAQTDPGYAHQYGPDFVAVKFERQAEGQVFEWGFFCLASLCRAQNNRIVLADHGEFPATSFE